MKAWVAAAALAAAASLYDDAVREDRPMPIYSADPADPWNRIHHLLFTRRLKVRIGGGPQGSEPKVERVEGGDLPEFFILPDVEYLLEGRRHGDLVKALERELLAPRLPSRTIEARVMFQQDLWNRFDALHGFRSSERPEAARSRAGRLGELLGRLMARVACTPAELAAVRPGFADAADAFPEVLDPRTFSADSGWREIVSTATGRAAVDDTTAHAMRAGYRIVFRRFVRVPEPAGGVRCLEEGVGPLPEGEGAPGRCSDGALPEGTRAVLLDTPLALASDGRIVPAPLVVGLQARTVASPGVFQLLHASRKALASPARPGAGLLALAPDALIPQLASLGLRYSWQPLVPMKASCPLCHGARGEALGTSRLHLRPSTQAMLPQNTVEQGRVARAKRGQASYAALQGFFAAP